MRNDSKSTKDFDGISSIDIMCSDEHGVCRRNEWTLKRSSKYIVTGGFAKRRKI